MISLYRTRRNRGRSNLIWTTLILVMSLQVILIMLPNLSFAQEVQNEKPKYIVVPPYYSRDPLKVDGYDNDWKDNRYTSVKFNATSLSPSMVPIVQNNILSGQILAKNNDTHLALLIKLDTLSPIDDQSRRVTLAFDENNDGESVEGDKCTEYWSNRDCLSTVIIRQSLR